MDVSSVTTEPGRRPGAVMVDVARQAGVSQKTVSRVINNAPHVRPEVRERVLAAVTALGYRPNLAARALVTQRTHVIGVVVVGLPLFGPAHQVFSLEHAARQRGYELALASLPDASPDELRRAVHSLLSRGVEGIIFEVPDVLLDLDPTDLLGVPVVSTGGRIPGVGPQAVVGTDHRVTGRIATQHLLDLGHETVFHVAGPKPWHAAQGRQEGWAAALAEAGRPCPEVLTGDWSPRSGYAAGRVLAARGDVTAVFAANDSQAIGVVRAFTEAGRVVPDDVSVVGVDDVPEAEFQTVPLTTVRGDDRLSSHRLLAVLVALIQHDPVPTGPSTSCELVVRSSTAPPPGRAGSRPG